MALRISRPQRQQLRHRPGGRERRHFFRVRDRTSKTDATALDADAGEPLVGVVGPQRKPVLGTRSEHAVGLAHPARDEIVDHHAEIRIGAVEHDRLARTRARRGVEAGDEPLPGRLLVAGRPIDLPGEKQPREPLRLQRRFELARIDVVVLDRVARADHMCALEPGNRRQQRALHFLRQRGRDSVRVDRGIVEPLGLEKDLVTVALAEADDLVLDRGAVARSAARDLAGIHR